MLLVSLLNLANPGVAHLEAAKCILRYLKGTANYHLVLERWQEVLSIDSECP